MKTALTAQFAAVVESYTAPAAAADAFMAALASQEDAQGDLIMTLVCAAPVDALKFTAAMGKALGLIPEGTDLSRQITLWDPALAYAAIVADAWFGYRYCGDASLSHHAIGAVAKAITAAA